MLGIVVGLTAEARLARGLGGLTEAGGGTADGAARAAAHLIANGATALLSFGLAGGLAPGLPAGTLVIPTTVTDGAGRSWPTDPAMVQRLGTGAGALLAASAILADAAEKQAAWQSTGALAADIESGAVARAAAAHGLPFAVLRAICDPAERTLPPAALTALDPAGRIRPLALARSLLRRPGQIGGLIALGREAALARTALLARVAATGPIG